MVEKLEVNSETGILRGKITHPDTSLKGSVICLHGNPNGDLRGSDGVFDQIAEAIAPNGFLTIQFSLNGSAPSDGRAEDTCLRTQITDYEAIFGYVRARFPHPVHVIGESAGATIASIRWKPEVATYVLLWPAFDLSDSDLRPYLNEHWQKIAKRDGFIRDNGVVVGAELISELLETDFAGSFRLPSCPILIVHGQADEEVPYQQSLLAVSNATNPFVFYSHPEAGHGFKRPDLRATVIDAVRGWFSKQ